MLENTQLEFARMENAHPGKCLNGNCTPPENDRKITPQKMTEKTNLENAKMEIAHPGKYQNGKCTTWKMPEWKLHTLENTRMENVQPGKYQNGNCRPWKMTKNQIWEMPE